MHGGRNGPSFCTGHRVAFQERPALAPETKIGAHNARGGARDLDQVRRLKFPCFSNGVICSHGWAHFVDVNVPVRVGGVTISPGDLLHGDANGVTTIPIEIASAVAHACEEYMAAEQVVMDYCQSAEVSVAGFAEARAECGRRIAALGERVRKR